MIRQRCLVSHCSRDSDSSCHPKDTCPSWNSGSKKIDSPTGAVRPWLLSPSEPLSLVRVAAGLWMSTAVLRSGHAQRVVSAGKGPGLLAVVLSALAITYYFLTTIYSFDLSAELCREFARLPRFFSVSRRMVELARKRAEVSLRRAHDDMELQVRARTDELRRGQRGAQEQASLLNLTHDTILCAI